MLHHIPVLIDGLDWFWACCCGWVPQSEDASLPTHLERQAAIAKVTRAWCDEKVVHLDRTCREDRVTWCPDYDRTMIAVRMGDWSQVAARLKEVEARGATDRDT